MKWRGAFPADMRRAILRYEPILCEGLTLYPVPVSEYEEFLQARVSLEILHKSLPVRYLTMPILEAFYRMDYDAVSLRQKPVGAFSSACLALALAMRLDGNTIKEKLSRVTVYTSSREPGKLVALGLCAGGDEIRLKPSKFKRVREVIAAQNGVETYGDEANPELVEAVREQAQLNAESLSGGVDEKTAFLSVTLHVDEEVIRTWPILKLERMELAARRAMDYAICAINEGAGAQWKGGNPVPHPYLERVRDIAGLKPVGDAFGGSIGLLQ